MIEASHIIGFASAALLAIAIAAWLKIWRRPELAGRARANIARLAEGELASRVLLLAAGVSAVAALLAIAGWIHNIS